MAKTYFRKLIWSEHITRYQWSQQYTKDCDYKFGLFEFVRMPFGLRNAAQTFETFIYQVLRGLPFAYAYIDNVLIASDSPDEHYQHLTLLFDRLKDYGVIINPVKCVLGVSPLEF